MTEPDQPLFLRTPSGGWRPDPLLRGPFDGLQGGAVAGLLSSHAENMARELDLGFISAFSCHFLRPSPIEDLTVVGRILWQGRRLAVVDVELAAAGEPLAVGRATLIRELHHSSTPVPPEEPADPGTGVLLQRPSPHGALWFMDAMEVRGLGDRIWFRLRRPLCEAQGAMTSVLPAADWAHGLAPPLGAVQPPRAAIPNPDLSVHLLCPPRGAWIGLRAASAWSAGGVGIGWADLFDVEGHIGRAAMSIAVRILGEQ